MSIVDCHVHLYPPEINRAPALWAEQSGETHWGRLCTRVRKSGKPVQSFPDVATLLSAMDAAGVERAVLQGWYWEKHDSCVLQNRFYADCLRAHPDRLSAFATLHPHAGTAAVSEEIAWAAENGFLGLGELSPHSQGVALEDTVWREVLSAAGERGLPVTLHVTDPASRPFPGRVLTPLEDFLRLAREYPDITFIFAHWGGRLPLHLEFGAEIKARRNVFYDTAASPLLYDSTVFSELLSAVGADHVLFGSDYPLDLYPRESASNGMQAFVGEIRSLGLQPDQLDQILGENILRVLSEQRG